MARACAVAVEQPINPALVVQRPSVHRPVEGSADGLVARTDVPASSFMD
jgi:hypothetical protein